MSKSKTDQAIRAGARPLTEAEVALVSGGLNPQPLPPRWRSFLVLKPFLLKAL